LNVNDQLLDDSRGEQDKLNRLYAEGAEQAMQLKSLNAVIERQRLAADESKRMQAELSESLRQAEAAGKFS
jgi:hypothetical protein